MWAGRSKTLIAGQVSMTIVLFLLGFFIYIDQNFPAFIMINLFVCCYQMTSGCVSWLYINEVTVDAASGFCAAAKWMNTILVVVTFEYIINSSLQAYGSFFMFAIISFIGAIFCCKYVKETAGLSDLERKTLYSPSQKDNTEKF